MATSNSNSKYYSVPHRGEANYSSVPVSKQRSLEGDQFKNFVQQAPLLHQQQQQQQQQSHHHHHHPHHLQQQPAEAPGSSSSISRSVSFMGGRQPRGPQQEATTTASTTLTSTSSNFGSSSWRASFDSGGRRSVESTPQSSRRQQPPQIYSSSSMKSPTEKSGTRTRVLPPPPTANAADGQSGQAIEGYCTPMINRKLSSASIDRSDSVLLKSKPQPKPRTSINSNNQSSPPALKASSQLQPAQNLQQLHLQQQLQQQLKESSHLSISQLVDSGMSALRDGNGNDDNEDDVDVDVKGNNNHKKFRRKDSSKMSPLQMYILEQAKLSGYRLRGGDTLNGDRDSYVESEDDRGRESDDFADDEVRFFAVKTPESIPCTNLYFYPIILPSYCPTVRLSLVHFLCLNFQS